MDLDLSDPCFYQDPYPVYARLRARGPIFRSEHGQWVATGFDEVSWLLKDPRVSVSFVGEPGWRARRGRTAVADGGRWMLFADGEVHRALRSPVGRCLTPRALAEERERVVATVSVALDALPRHKPVDFAADVVEPIVATLLCDLLGLPAGHEQSLSRWSSAIIRMSDPIAPATIREATDTAMREFRAFIEYAWKSGSLHPGGLATHLLTKYATINIQDGLANLVLLPIAALDTTVSQLCTALLGLLNHPDQLALAREEPALAGAALEFARYDNPVQIVTRRIAADIDTAAGTMRTGQKLMLLLSAANRDPSRYPDPDRLWLARPDVASLGFGGGPHFCVGAHLAQPIMNAVLTGVVRRYPRLELAETKLQWRQSVVSRRMEKLPVRLEAE